MKIFGCEIMYQTAFATWGIWGIWYEILNFWDK